MVIGIIAILAGIVIVAINPSKQLATVRNTQRKSDLKQIYNAITQYYIDNSSFPPTISTTTLNEVCNTGAVSNTSTSTNGVNCATAGLANLSVLVPTYLVSIPTDPTGTSSLLSFIPTAYAATTATGTGYKVGVNTSKQVLISAPLAELGVTVAVGNVPTTATACSATGGTISTTTGYRIHTFTDVGEDTFEVTSGSCNVEVLVVAGGGGGGFYGAAGGGAGGLVYNASYTIASGNHTVVVGAGGLAHSTATQGSGYNGVNSSIDSLIAIGGGGGGGNFAAGNSGGCGGGGSWGAAAGGNGSQGGNGGAGAVGTAGSGGGGGVGGNGEVGYADGYGGAGGDGTSAYSDLLISVNAGVDIGGVHWIGGGGGSSWGIGARGLGGKGGGGNGGTDATAATSAIENTGGGGGGAWVGTPSGAGGSGIVIVRYPTN